MHGISLNTIEFLDTYVFISNPYWQVVELKYCSANIMFLDISDTLVGSFLDMFFLLLAGILSDLHKNREWKIESQKKVHRRIVNFPEIYYS